MLELTVIKVKTIDIDVCTELAHFLNSLKRAKVIPKDDLAPAAEADGVICIKHRHNCRLCQVRWRKMPLLKNYHIIIHDDLEPTLSKLWLFIDCVSIPPSQTPQISSPANSCSYLLYFSLLYDTLNTLMKKREFFTPAGSRNVSTPPSCCES